MSRRRGSAVHGVEGTKGAWRVTSCHVTPFLPSFSLTPDVHASLAPDVHAFFADARPVRFLRGILEDFLDDCLQRALFKRYCSYLMILYSLSLNNPPLWTLFSTFPQNSIYSARQSFDLMTVCRRVWGESQLLMYSTTLLDYNNHQFWRSRQSHFRRIRQFDHEKSLSLASFPPKRITLVL